MILVATTQTKTKLKSSAHSHNLMFPHTCEPGHLMSPIYLNEELSLGTSREWP